MKYLWLLLLCLTPCGVRAQPMTDTATNATQQAVIASLNDGVLAWNRGDLNGFMAGYLHSDEMTFTAAGRLIRGYDALRTRYQETYGNSTASMGQLSFSDIQVWPLGPDNALAVGNWTLNLAPSRPVVAYHTANPKDTAGGVFSLVLRKTPEGWKILHDHTSRSEKK